MIDVTVEGVVRRKSTLNEGTRGKYFFCYLFDKDGNSIRIAAFKCAAAHWFGKLNVEKFYRIRNVSVRQNVFNQITELQIILGPDIQIEEIADISPTQIPFVSLSSLKSLQKGAAVDVIGRILGYERSTNIEI